MLRYMSYLAQDKSQNTPYDEEYTEEIEYILLRMQNIALWGPLYSPSPNPSSQSLFQVLRESIVLSTIVFVCYLGLDKSIAFVYR
ncbi:unnamed protein product [Phytomonas sp. EM1]|nr:unnamed protein product [Phytomonas sp. EM1]|eukprot:CCW65269.1 unnamed protein product [Phytomonas sp. isolate EM1]